MIKFIEAINTITNKKNKKRGFPSSLFSCSVIEHLYVLPKLYHTC